MKTIIDQLAEEMKTKAEWITNIKIDEEYHTVDFECGGSFWANLSKDNRKVLKNSVRTSTA